MRRLKAFGLSDIGNGRKNNEDEWIALTDVGFFALADGMGGHQAGDIAAQETIRFLGNLVQQIGTSDCVELIIELRHAIEKTNQRVFSLGKSHETLKGMGSTLCCVFWKKDAIICAHVGDSRIYRYRQGKLTALTRDHSLLAQWLSTGKMAEECKTPFPYKNVITRAIGTGKKANPEIAISTHEPGDFYLLCSDGLSDVLSVFEMEEIIHLSSHLQEIGEQLIGKAKNKGGPDNMTVVVVQEDS